MPRLLQAATLFVVLVLVFQCNPNIRAWQREALQRVLQGAAPAPPATESLDDAQPANTPPPHPPQPSDDPWQGDSPKSPVVTVETTFPGPGWYRVKVWRGWLAEGLCECVKTSHRRIVTEDEWWDMAWGQWEKGAGAEVAADARMHTTNGVRLDQPPGSDSLARD